MVWRFEMEGIVECDGEGGYEVVSAVIVTRKRQSQP